MNTFKYTCEENPKEAVELAKSFTKDSVLNSKEAYNVMINVMKQADKETKAELLAKLREIHPDSDLYRDDNGVGFWRIKTPEREDFQVQSDLAIKSRISEKGLDAPVERIMMNACGCGGHTPNLNASGGTNVGSQTDSATTLKLSELNAELKAEKTTKSIIFNVVIVTVLCFIMYKLFVKK